ncbi:hypothetical protein NECAME_01335 [Necator americanus]|uniref:Uncharacterized protein n=1 Tax=Necator americanus TaxID=51031 RepID=W2TYU7_NECAM|nr:hypothetical protein NECAME_01335 [Necator americanus]ETN86207.1 hypothetical protein NECAME_01335 [Necator americanus]
MRGILPLLFVLANLPLLDAEEEYEYDEYHEHYKDIDINDHYMIIRNIKKCKAMDKELRKLIEQFHFYLRQMAATGFRYRDVPLKLTLMNGLLQFSIGTDFERFELAYLLRNAQRSV